MTILYSIKGNNLMQLFAYREGKKIKPSYWFLKRQKCNFLSVVCLTY